MQIPAKIGLIVLSYLLLLNGCELYGQDQNKADSLETIYARGNFSKEKELFLLNEISYNQLEIDKKIAFSTKLIEKATAVDSIKKMISGYLQLGTAYRLKGDLSEALQNYFKAAELAEKNAFIDQAGIINITIADAYSIMGSHQRSLMYYRDAIKTLRIAKDSISLGSALLNAGDEFFNYDELDSALVYFKESGEIFNALDYKSGVAYNLGNMGLVLAKMGNYAQA